MKSCLGRGLMRYCRQHSLGCVNASDSGAGPIEYLDRVNFLAKKLKPQLVLLFYHAGNDLTDVMEEPNRIPMGLHAPKVKNWVFEWDTMLKHGIAPDLVRRARATHAAPHKVGDQAVSPWLLQTALDQPQSLVHNLLLESPQARQAWTAVRRKLRQTVAVARAHGAQFQLVIIPSTAQVDRRGHAFMAQAGFKVKPQMLTAALPQQLLRHMCEAEGVEVLDLLPMFRASPERARLYWARDDHFSERGHRLALQQVLAQLVQPWLRRVSGSRRVGPRH